MDSFLIRRTGAECIGVFFLVLGACGSVTVGGLTGAYGHMGMALFRRAWLLWSWWPLPVIFQWPI